VGLWLLWRPDIEDEVGGPNMGVESLLGFEARFAFVACKRHLNKTEDKIARGHKKSDEDVMTIHKG